MNGYDAAPQMPQSQDRKNFQVRRVSSMCSIKYSEMKTTICGKGTSRFGLWATFIGLMALLFTGCASVETTTRPQHLNQASLTKPDKILLYDFAVSPQEVRLDEGWSADIGRTARGQEGTPRSQLELEVGHKVARALSESLVIELGKYGILAQRTTREPMTDEKVHIVKGRFLSIDEGNQTQRMVVGFGVGRSVVRAQGKVFKMTPKGKELLTEFESEVKSGRKPGMGPMVGVGAIAGNAAVAAGVSGGLGVASEAADSLPFSASLTANVQKMAEDLSKKAARHWVKRGWLPPQVLK